MRRFLLTLALTAAGLAGALELEDAIVSRNW